MNTCDTPGCQIDHTGDWRTKNERLMDAIFDTPESVREARRLGHEYAFDHGPAAYLSSDTSDEATAFWESVHRWTRATQKLVDALGDEEGSRDGH